MPDTDHPLYLDPDQPVAARVQDLLGRLSLEEKLGQFNHSVPAVPRLGLPAYNYWNEALHGVARNGRATVFPQAIGLAATWDPALIKRLAGAIADEGRAKYHEALRRNGESGQYQGLTFWSPNVNIFRDPRWGRGQETWGEDPALTGEMAAAFVRGLQGDHPVYLKAAACAKHFAVHSGPERLRHVFNAEVSPRDLHGTYLPAFRKLVTEARVEAVMGAYNRTGGQPCCASPDLLGGILRDQWGFAGHVTSDCGALDDIHERHKLTPGPVETAALALKAGCDLACGGTYDHLGEALTRGLIEEADLDRALTRTLATRFKLGMFDPPERVPYAATPMRVVESAAHSRLAHQAALRSAVLLKNKGGILPLAPGLRSLLVTGPAAISLEALLGNYFGLNGRLTSLLEGLVSGAPEGLKLEYRPGCQWTQPSAGSRDWTIHEAASADVTIFCGGLSPLMEGEEGDTLMADDGGDRSDIALPAEQLACLREMHAAGARIVLVLTGGSPIALNGLEDLVEAILMVWYPGQAGGRAAADLIFGRAAPSGKLPVTFPHATADLPAFEDYSLSGRTHRFAAHEPLFPFGFGLSYTTFAYSNLRLKPEGEGRFTISVTVANIGDRAGEEVVQVYLSDLEASVPVPLQNLIGFKRAALGPGASRRLTFQLTPEMLMLYDEDGRQRLEPGRFRLTAGGCSPSARGLALGAPEPQTLDFEIDASG